jgi:putative oxidoreductase
MFHKTNDTLISLGLLVLRAGTSALLIYGHGWPKLATFAERADRFADPLHVGPAVSLGLAVFAEVLCAALVFVGLATRAALVPLLILFGVIVFVVHGADPFPQKEKALLFAVAFLALLVTGPGRFSIDGAGQGSGGGRR